MNTLESEHFVTTPVFNKFFDDYKETLSIKCPLQNGKFKLDYDYTKDKVSTSLCTKNIFAQFESHHGHNSCNMGIKDKTFALVVGSKLISSELTGQKSSCIANGSYRPYNDNSLIIGASVNSINPSHAKFSLSRMMHNDISLNVPVNCKIDGNYSGYSCMNMSVAAMARLNHNFRAGIVATGLFNFGTKTFSVKPQVKYECVIPINSIFCIGKYNSNVNACDVDNITLKTNLEKTSVKVNMKNDNWKYSIGLFGVRQNSDIGMEIGIEIL